MTLPLSNNAEGGSNGTTVTTGNSGGASGDAFDGVTIGASGGLVFSSTQFEDALSYKIDTPATSVNVLVEWTTTTIGTQTTLFARVYLYLLANPVSQPIHLIKFRDGSTEKGAVIIQTGGTIALRDNGGAIGGAMTATVNLNQWVRIEAKIVCNTTTGTIEAILFNSPNSSVATETLTKTNRNTGTQVTNARFGETSVSGTITARTFYVDDLQTNATAYAGTAHQLVTAGVGVPFPTRPTTIPTPTVTADAATDLVAIAQAATIPTTDIALETFITPAAITQAATIPTVTVTVESSPSITLTTVARVATIPTAIVTVPDAHVTLTTVARSATIPHLGLHLTHSAPGGWGLSEWGDSPWGGAELPFIPGGNPIIGRDEFPAELPPLEHKIIGPNGVVDHPTLVSGFAADEDVGFATLSGTVEAERVRDQPELYTDGAQWIVTDSATGEIVAAGDLLTPAIGGGSASLKADGWAKRLARRGERLMYQTRGYSDIFVPKNSEPYGPNGHGFYVTGEEKFTIDSTGALRWHVAKGGEAFTEDDQQGFVASFGGLRPGVRRIAGHIHSSIDGPNFVLRAATADTPSGGLSGYVTIQNMSASGTDWDFDVDLPIPAYILDIDLKRTTGGTPESDIDVTVTDLVIYGIASDDRWSASDVGRDIAGRLGFATRIDESVFNVLPLDGGADGVYQDPLDVACLLSGMFYRVLGISPGVPVLEMRRRGTVRWEVVDPEFSVEPIPLPRYDSVLVPYTLSNGVAQDVLEVSSVSIDRPPLPVARSYGPVPLPDPLPNADNARLLGQQILTLVYPERFGGRATFSRVYGPGGFATAHEVHAQDVIVLPLNGGMVLPIRTLHREGGLAEATFDDGIAAVDRLLARKSRQTLLKHPH